MVRYSGTEFYGTREGDEIVGEIAGSIIDSRFKENQFYFADDGAVSISRFEASGVSLLIAISRD